jgi:hypothetical protein
MIATRRVLIANNAKLAQRRVVVSQARPHRRAPQHVRGYRSSLQNPYFANPGMLVESPPCSGHQDYQSFWQQAFRWYSEKLTTHPLLTKGLTGGIIAAAGDLLCQAGTYKEPEDGTKRSFWNGGWDVKRSLNFAILGLTFVAPTSHYWYGKLAVHPWSKGQSFAQISKRVALDQFLWSPVFFVIWLAGFWGLEKDGNITSKELKNDLAVALPDIMVANWILWIPCQYANFYAVPVKYQVLFCNVVELVWNAYMSFATSGGGGHGGGGAEKAMEEETKHEQAGR